MATTYTLPDGAADWAMKSLTPGTFATADSRVGVGASTGGNPKMLGMCFSGIPEGYHVVSAILRFNVFFSYAGTALQASYVDAAGQTPPTSGTEANALSWTTAATNITIGYVPSDTWFEVDVTTAVRSILAKGGTSAHLRLTQQSGEAIVWARDSGTTKDPELVLEMARTGSATLSASPTMTVVGRSSTVLGSATLSCAPSMTVKGYQSNIVLTCSPSMTVRGRTNARHHGNGEPIGAVVTGLNGAAHLARSSSRQWSITGGPLQADLDDAYERLSMVRLFDENGCGWSGWVWSESVAIGAAAPLTMSMRAAYYALRETSGWTDEGLLWNGSYPLRIAFAENTIAALTDKGLANYNGFRGLAMLRLPEEADYTITATWERPTLDWRIQVDAWAVENGVGALSGTLTYTGHGDFIPVLLQCADACSQSDIGDGRIALSNVSVTTAEGITIPVTPDRVIKECVAHMPDWTGLVFGDDALDHIDASTATIDSLAFEADSRDSDKLSEAIKYDSMIYHWAPIFVGMEQRHVPFYRARPEEPSVMVDGAFAKAAFESSDMEALASALRVRHKDASGGETVTTVYDPDESHELVRRGVTAFAAVSAETTSSSDVEKLATVEFARLGVESVRGSVTVTSLMNAHGARVPLAELLVGDIMRYLGDKPLTPRITTVRRDDFGAATVTLDDAPYGL